MKIYSSFFAKKSVILHAKFLVIKSFCAERGGNGGFSIRCDVKKKERQEIVLPLPNPRQNDCLSLIG